MVLLIPPVRGFLCFYYLSPIFSTRTSRGGCESPFASPPAGKCTGVRRSPVSIPLASNSDRRCPMTRGTFIWPDQRSREVLPIDSYLEEILGLLEHHQVVVVEAETGAGKTTRIGQAVVLANPRQRAIMTLPRRNAVRWNGKRIACEMGCEPGELVGWRLFGEDPTVSRMTRLELRVDQSLANQI